MNIHSNLDEIVDRISSDFEIVIRKPRMYSYVDGGFLRLEVDGSFEKRTVKEAFFGMPRNIVRDQLALEGYFAHEITELSRFFDGCPLQRICDFFTAAYQNTYENLDLFLEENMCNPFKIIYNVGKKLFLSIPYYGLAISNNIMVDRSAKKKGYGDAISAVRKAVGHVHITF